jgi:hypothetical protein
MKILVISAVAAILASTQIATASVDERMKRLAVNTICIVSNSFYLREMTMLTVGSGIAAGNVDVKSLEKNVIEPVARSNAILEEDRQRVIRELIELGATPQSIGESLAEVITAETVDSVQSWMQVTDAGSALQHFAKIMSKHRACDAHYKRVRGQPI